MARPLLLAAIVMLAGCSAMETADYYLQGASGQLDILARRKPIAQVLQESDDAVLKQRLLRVQEIRTFASRELGLPDNRSYTQYADVGRPYVVWNVFATPALSLQPRQWCFPVAGCVNYRGYFAETEARREAARLQAEGQDVFVSGVPAYSTLGYFDDPVLSTFIRWPDIDVARMVFHELAHQVAYAKDDTQFNESFAVAVEEAGLARWLQAQGNPLIKTQFTRSQNLRARFSDLTRETRARLVAVYSSNLPDEEKRRAKAEAFTEMREGYERAKAGEPGLAGYDRWFAGYANAGPNNAGLSSISLYSVNVPAFRALLTRDGGNLPRFYARVKALAAKPKYERDAVLANALKPEIETASVAAQ